MTQNNYKFAITGGIGSGKSTVAEILRRQGFAVFSCDEIYKALLCDKKFLNKISREFDGVLCADGSLNRNKLAEIVFADKSALEKLNAITHPAIMEEVFKKAEGHKISFTEVPLLFESGYEEFFDGIIVVLRNEEERIAAVAQRDGLDPQTVVLRIKSQFNYDNCNFAKYYVIHNDSNLGDLEQKIAEILKKINGMMGIHE